MRVIHKLSFVPTTSGNLWIIRCSYNGLVYVFRYAYDKKPSDDLLKKLSDGRQNIDWETNLAFNYWEASGLANPIMVQRKTTAKDYWHIIRH